MKTAIALVATALAIGFAPAGSVAEPVARMACTRDTPAIIGGAHKCLGAGEYCANVMGLCVVRGTAQQGYGGSRERTKSGASGRYERNR
jgi:hypothetical protein